LWFDGEGSLKFKLELWGDIRMVILPTLHVEILQYLKLDADALSF
jgi:hypothetical protein